MSQLTGPIASRPGPVGHAHTAYPPAGLGHGVVPLRPLQAGEILDGAVTTMRAYPGVMLGLSALVVTLGQAVAIPLDYVYLHFLAGLVDDNTTLGSGTGIDNLALLRPSVLLNALIVSLLVGLVATAVSRAVLGRPVTLGESGHRPGRGCPASRALAADLRDPVRGVGPRHDPGLLLAAVEQSGRRAGAAARDRPWWRGAGSSTGGWPGRWPGRRWCWRTSRCGGR